MEETRRLIRQNHEELSIQVEEPEVNGGQSEGGNYSGTVGQANPPIVCQNNQDRGNDGRGCKYKDFMGSKPPCKSWTGSPRWRQCSKVASVATDRRPLLQSLCLNLEY